MHSARKSDRGAWVEHFETDALATSLHPVLLVGLIPNAKVPFRDPVLVQHVLEQRAGEHGAHREPVVLALGSELLSYLSVSALFVTVALNYTGALQGAGDTRSPLAITLISQLVVPIGYLTFTEMTRGLVSADVWGAILVGHILRCVLSVARFEQGKWIHIKVNIEGRGGG